MDENKIAFIICVNNEQYFNECSSYIRSLIVPEGMSIEIIPIYHAESMCAGYNKGMKSTDAKYKVYLHQDVFIINKNFITDILRAFSEDEKIGMMGVVGCGDLPGDAICIYSWDTGTLIECRSYETIMYPPVQSNVINYVWVVDGLMIITNRNIPWREDVFDGWDFYDISQGMEYMKAGLRVAVPYQNMPWCYHDNGILVYDAYDKYRKKFCETYSEYFEYDESGSKYYMENVDCRDVIRKATIEIKNNLDNGKYVEAVNIAAGYHNLKNKDSELFAFYAIAAIIIEEFRAEKDCFIRNRKNSEELLKEYMQLRFFLIRAAVGAESGDRLKEMLDNGDVSREALEILIDLNWYDGNELRKKLFN